MIDTKGKVCRVAKLLRFGPSSCGIVLPGDWLKTNRLEKGDAVEMLYDGDVVIIRRAGGKDDLKGASACPGLQSWG